MLVPCSSCRRHVRSDDACPFCGGAPGQLVEARLAPRIARAIAIVGAVGLHACYGAPDVTRCEPDADAACAIDAGDAGDADATSDGESDAPDAEDADADDGAAADSASDG